MNSIELDTAFRLSSLQEIVVAAVHNINYNRIDSCIIETELAVTGFDFCQLIENELSENISFKVHRDSYGSIILIEQEPTTAESLKCRYYLYQSKLNRRFTVMFAKEMSSSGKWSMLEGCFIHDGLKQKVIYMCWNIPGNYLMRNLSSVMLLNCDDLEVKSYSCFVSGEFKHYAHVSDSAGHLYRKCYTGTTKTVWQFKLDELYESLEMSIPDSKYYNSSPIYCAANRSNYPLWYRNGYYLIAGGAKYFPK